jgi:hypothetical protein
LKLIEFPGHSIRRGDSQPAYNAVTDDLQIVEPLSIPPGQVAFMGPALYGEAPFMPRKRLIGCCGVRGFEVDNFSAGDIEAQPSAAAGTGSNGSRAAEAAAAGESG